MQANGKVDMNVSMDSSRVSNLPGRCEGGQKPPSPASDRILTKSRTMEYLTLDGLTKMTGVPPQSLDVYTLKELIDNALDAAELTALCPDIEVTLARGEDILTLEVADQGRGLSAEMVHEVTNFERFGGTKYFG